MKNLYLMSGKRALAFIAASALLFALVGGSIMQKAGAVSAAPSCSANDPQTVVSDTTTQVDDHDAVAVTPHPAWTSIDGATWIYSQALDENGSSPIGSKTFTKTFTITGDPTDSSLQIAADNYYTVSVNGHDIDTGASATTLDNFSSGNGAPHTWAIPAADLQSGDNTITVTVTNPGTDPDTGNPFGDPNPAGLLYKLTVNSQTCVSPDVTVTIVKYRRGIHCLDLPNFLPHFLGKEGSPRYGYCLRVMG